jgi:hypothetical protein
VKERIRKIRQSTDLMLFANELFSQFLVHFLLLATVGCYGGLHIVTRYNITLTHDCVLLRLCNEGLTTIYKN